MKSVKMGAAAWVVFLSAALAACGPSSGAGPGAAADRTGGVTAQAAADGAVLYDANCAGCHGPLATSGVAGASAGAISSAIANNTGGMGSITLTSTEIADIALALAGSGGGGGGSDGAALYAASCAGCHGPLATSQVRGESAGSIREAIQENEGGMGALAALTDADLQAIATALGGGSGGGGDDDGEGEGEGEGEGGDHHGGGGDDGGGGGGGGSGDGAALYTANCAGCHGALATSQVRGESASDIAEAIAENKGGMGALSLTSAQLQAIASALGGGSGSGGGGEGGGGRGGHRDDRILTLGASHVVRVGPAAL